MLEPCAVKVARTVLRGRGCVTTSLPNTGDKSYNHSTDLFDLFGDNKKLAQETFLQPYKLIDLSKIPDDKLKEFLRYGVLARTMKHVYKKDFLIILSDMIRDLNAIVGFGEEDFVKIVFSYIIDVNEMMDKQEFLKIIETGLTKTSRDNIMTLAEQFKQEGVQEGIQEGYNKAMLIAEQKAQESLEKGKLEGKLEGKQEAMETIALRLLNQGIDFNKIIAATGLTSEQIEKIKNKA